MRIFLDTSDVDVIRQHCETGLIDGVTTNPTLMMQAGRDPVEVIKEISSLFPGYASISAEVVGDTAEEMVLQAKDYLPNWRQNNLKLNNPHQMKVHHIDTVRNSHNFVYHNSLSFRSLYERLLV